MDRIKFYSSHDMTCGHGLAQSAVVLAEYESGRIIADINDVIELYNISRFFDQNLRLDSWSAEIAAHYIGILKRMQPNIAKHVKNISDDDFFEIYSSLSYKYKDDFWSLAEKYGRYSSISKDAFTEHLSLNDLRIILKHKKIVNHFGLAIRDYMLANPSTAKLLFDQFEVRHRHATDHLFFPKELSGADKTEIVNLFIDDPDAELNYLQLIANVQSSKEGIELSPKMIHNAKRKAEAANELFFVDNPGFTSSVSVSFSEKLDDALQINYGGFSIEASYSLKWVYEYNDYATLMNNFIYLFGFADMQMRIALVSKPNNMSIIERSIGLKSKREYEKGMAFGMFDALANLQMKGYSRALLGKGIRIEDLISWFFSVYLKSEFGVEDFKVFMPSSSLSYHEKCNVIIPAFESTLKQYMLFVQEGSVDFGLLDIRSEHLFFENIPSMLEKKYVYGKGTSFEKACFLLFSNQCLLSYTERLGSNHDTFFDLISNERITTDDYSLYHRPDIEWLEREGYVRIDDDLSISFLNTYAIQILKDLYLNEVICYWSRPKEGRAIIDRMVNQGMIEFENTLFSRSEQAYYNYFLNRSQFTNGLDLRNKYSHSQPFFDERVHEVNYMIFLRLYICAIIKVNDEFCLKEKCKASENKDI